MLNTLDLCTYNLIMILLALGVDGTVNSFDVYVIHSCSLI